MSEVHLVKRGDLEKTLDEILVRERTVVEDIEKTLPHIRDSELVKLLTKRLGESKGAIVALEAGFVPIEDYWFFSVDSKNKWTKKRVEEVVKTMPTEVTEAWERVKALGIFKVYGVQGGKTGDPILAGKIGKKYYFIASWINFPKGLAVGFTAKGVRQ